jgi:heavy metal translocating P-type ATPase
MNDQKILESPPTQPAQDLRPGHEETEETEETLAERAKWPSARIARAVRRYPLPFAAIFLLVVAGILSLLGLPMFAQGALLLIIVIGGVPLLIETARQVWRREFGVDVIAILAIAGSAALGQYLAGAIIVLMLSGGEALEAFALRRARSSLSALAQRAPRNAHVRQGHTLVTIPASDVEIDMLIVVKPGELIPVDGVVVSGSSGVSEADLTGEPLPQRKEPGSLVLSGSVNLETVLEVRAMRRSSESQYAQIVRLVEEAQTRKAPIHRLADRYAVWFTAITVTAAGTTWLLSGSALNALAVLVVATPCPLILATPIAIMSGIDRAAKAGIILKSGAAMEQLGEVDVAVFDKTGTLTLGAPALLDIVRVGEHDDLPHLTDNQVLSLAASIEQFSAHVLARAVVQEARERQAPLCAVSEVRETTGHGLRGRVRLADGADERVIEVAVGNRKFLRALTISPPQALVAERERRTEDGQIASYLALDTVACALLVFADRPRPELATLMARLKVAGIQETALLTGDVERVAERVAQLASIEHVQARCLPADKVRFIEERQEAGKRVLMIGDGVNDAPALATATVGMAVGGQELTASAVAADAVLLSPNILRVATAVRLGRRVLRVAKQGIWVGMGLSVVAMFFAAKGDISPTVGAILQEGVDVLVVLNALRAGRLRETDAPSPASRPPRACSVSGPTGRVSVRLRRKRPCEQQGESHASNAAC